MSTCATVDCRFLRLNIGFKPQNVRWDESVDLGLWNFGSSALITETESERKTNKCLKFPGDFSGEFIRNDFSWLVARCSAIMSVVVGWIAFVLLCIMGINSDLLPSHTKSLMRIHLNWKQWVLMMNVMLLVSEALKFCLFMI